MMEDKAWCGANKIDAGDLAHHTAILGSDEYEGRLPGTAAESKTLDYLVDELRKVLLLQNGGRLSQLLPLGWFKPCC